MNIWIFNHYAITPNYPGGTRHFDFSKELIKRGHRVTIFASSFHYMLLEETKSYKGNFFIEEDYEGVKFVWIKTPGYKKSDWRRVINMLVYSFRAYLAGRILGRKEKPDVIIGSSVHLFAPLIAYFLSKHYKTPFILEIRDVWPRALIELGVNKYHPFIILLSWIEKFLYKKADKIISLLDKIGEYLANYGVKQEKFLIIPNGINVARLENCINEDSNTNFDGDVLKIGYAGALGYGNNSQAIVYLARVLVEKYRKVKLSILGGGYDKEIILEQLQDYKEIVYFEGSLPKDKIYEKLFSFDILLFKVANLGDYGLSSNKLFDYLAVGKPIIFWANIPNNIVEEIGAGITVKEDNPYKVLEAIERIISMTEDERNQMGQRGRKYVLENHDIRKLAEKLENVIKEVCDDFVKNK